MGTPEAIDGAEAARRWLQNRVDAKTVRSAQEFLRATAEDLSIASGDACTIRVLSADSRWLLPLAVHHPNPVIQKAMEEATRQTAEKTTAGLWVPVVHERRVVVYDVAEQRIPPEASPAQVEFLRAFPVTSVMGAPVLRDDDVLGGVSLVRYVDRRPFSDLDRGLLEDVAVRAASAIDFGRLSYLDPEELGS